MRGHPARPARPRRHGRRARPARGRVPPALRKNGRFYVHYNTPAGNTRVVEYRQRKPGQEVSARVRPDACFDFARPEWNHNGGWLGFGPDGYLYIALGRRRRQLARRPVRQRPGQERPVRQHPAHRRGQGQPVRDPQGQPLCQGRRSARSCGTTACAIPGGRASTARPGISGSAMSARTRSRRSTSSGRARAASTSAGRSWKGRSCHKRANCSTRGLTLPVTEYTHGAKGCSVIGGYVYRGRGAAAAVRAPTCSRDYCSKHHLGHRCRQGARRARARRPSGCSDQDRLGRSCRSARVTTASCTSCPSAVASTTSSPVRSRRGSASGRSTSRRIAAAAAAARSR